MPDYDRTSSVPTARQLAAMLRRHIPGRTRRTALSHHSKDKSANNAVSAHRVLDMIGIERVEAALADAVPLDYLCRHLKITPGQFWSWVNADDERNRRVEKARFSGMNDSRLQVYHDIMDMTRHEGTALDKDELEWIKMRMKAAESIGEVLARPDPKKVDEGGIKVNIDFGSLFK